MTTVSAYRLPTTVQPLKYALTLTPDLDSFSFAGEETIEIQVTEATSSIAVNAIEIDILEARLALENGASLTAQNIALDEEMETASFAFGQEIPPGNATLYIKFNGTLNDQLRGFYRSQYTDPEGEQRYLATTQFEATDARRAFPCWDDPRSQGYI